MPPEPPSPLLCIEVTLHPEILQTQTIAINLKLSHTLGDLAQNLHLLSDSISERREEQNQCTALPDGVPEAR